MAIFRQQSIPPMRKSWNHSPNPGGASHRGSRCEELIKRCVARGFGTREARTSTQLQIRVDNLTDNG